VGPISADEVTQLAKRVVSRMRAEAAVAFQNEHPMPELMAEVCGLLQNACWLP
jgi:hypothetical protein